MQHISYEVTKGVAVITLNRPEHLNAFTDQMEREIIECFDLTDADDAVRAVILTGAGRAFCAGLDLRESNPGETFTAWRSSATAPLGTQFSLPGSELPLRRDSGGHVSLRIFHSLKPVIAAINGHAVGVGITMTLPADIRIGAREAKYSLPFTRRAFVPEGCSSWFLPRVVGPQQAAEWILTGRTFDAQEALQGGLLRSVHPASEVLSAAMELAREIADNTSPASVALARRMLWDMLTRDHPMDAHAVETIAINHRGVSADAQEGVTAFIEKRTPAFSDPVVTEINAVLPQPSRAEYLPPPQAIPFGGPHEA